MTSTELLSRGEGFGALQGEEKWSAVLSGNDSLNFANQNHVLNFHRVFGDRFHGSICMSIRVNPCKLDISEVTSAAPLSSAQQDQVWCAVVPFTFSTYF